MNAKNYILKIRAAAVIFLVVSILFASCSKDKNEGSSIEITGGQAGQTVYADDNKGASNITFKTAGAWTSTITEGSALKSVADEGPWLSINPDHGDAAGNYTVGIDLTENYTGSDRTATIGIICNGEKIEIIVTQKGTSKSGQIPVQGVMINGLLWATKNVGTQPGKLVGKPEDYGGYYTFPEAQTACPVGWRTPTSSELFSLFDFHGYFDGLDSLNEVPGLYFGSGNNKIFLPAAGFRGTDGTMYSQGYQGQYWTSTKEYATESNPRGLASGFNMRFIGNVGGSEYAYGYCVRCVTGEVATNPVTGVSLDKSEITLNAGDADILTATVAPDNATYKDVVWTSSDTDIATVDGGGVVTAIAPGTATISVLTIDNGFTASCTITVNERVVHVTGISLDKTEITLNAGDAEILTATVAPDNATYKDVVWASSNTGIATVDDTGRVTAIAPGIATIRVVTIDGDFSASCAVTVSERVIHVTGISLDKSAITLSIGDTETLTATIVPSNATYNSVGWSSSDAGVATVDNNGRVTAAAQGTATISAYNATGEFSAECIVTVTGSQSGEGIVINGVTWALTNVAEPGKFADSPRDYGGYYTFDEAQTACPNGWRLPTEEEFKSLIAAGYEWIIDQGEREKGGSWFGSGSNRIYLPGAGYRYSGSSGIILSEGVGGYYWSSTPVELAGNEGHNLHFSNNSEASTYSGSHASGFSIRCVKK